MQDLHDLPKLRDSLSYLYVEHAIINRKDSALELVDQNGVIQAPAANLCVLILGPGTSITHAAVRVLAENGCSVLWTGEEMTRFYAQGMGETRKAYHLLRQAELTSDPTRRIEVVLRMYRKRFQEPLPPDLTLAQIRGFEGVRVRRAYSRLSQEYGVKWTGRKYDREAWNAGDPINRAISAANALLNSLCHAAIVSGGYSPGLGFIHTGKQLSFVYDVADLYKVDLTLPVAFQMAAESSARIEARTRQACREAFRQSKLLDRILPDIDDLLQVGSEPEDTYWVDEDPALPADLWGPLIGEVVEGP